MFRKIVCLMIALFLLLGVAFANEDCPDGECKAWTQEMFSELVTFLYNNGESVPTIYGDNIYNITLSAVEDGSLVAHLGFYPTEYFVILTVEAFDYGEDGTKVIDHNFYYSYFDKDIGEYWFLPNYIDGNIVITKDSAVRSLIPKVPQQYKKEGYDNEEWAFWMGLFYEYMLVEKAKGEET